MQPMTGESVKTSKRNDLVKLVPGGESTRQESI